MLTRFYSEIALTVVWVGCAALAACGIVALFG
jgi:hypothetical protein